MEEGYKYQQISIFALKKRGCRFPRQSHDFQTILKLYTETLFIIWNAVLKSLFSDSSERRCMAAYSLSSSRCLATSFAKKPFFSISCS